MDSLLQTGNHGSFNTNYTKIIRCYGIKYLSEVFTLQEDKTIDGQVSKYSELAVWEIYFSEIQTNKKWYWWQEKHHQILIVPTLTIAHPFLYNTVVKYIVDIPKCVFSFSKQAQNHCIEAKYVSLIQIMIT